MSKNIELGIVNMGPQIITFDCDKVIVNDMSLETQWKNGVPLNFEDYDTLIFSGNGKKYTFKKVK
ncbi:MAG: hypothetical protein ACC656_08805 [Candidatus Heimdallarchaeota archaeon]